MSNRKVTGPTSIESPARKVAGWLAVSAEPFSRVPLLDRSSVTIQPEPCGATTAWRRLTRLSSTTTSRSALLPMVIDFVVSAMRSSVSSRCSIWEAARSPHGSEPRGTGSATAGADGRWRGLLSRGTARRHGEHCRRAGTSGVIGFDVDGDRPVDGPAMRRGGGAERFRQPVGEEARRLLDDGGIGGMQTHEVARSEPPCRRPGRPGRGASSRRTWRVCSSGSARPRRTPSAPPTLRATDAADAVWDGRRRAREPTKPSATPRTRTRA